MRHIISVLLIVLAVSFFAITALKAREAERLPDSFVRDPPLIDMPTDILSMVFLGFRNVYENFVSIWAVHYLAAPDVTVYDVDQLDRMLKKVANMRHRRETLYVFSCFILSTLQRPEACVDILTTAMEVMPESWRVPFTLGIIYMEDLNDFRKAAIYLNMCSERKYSPTYIKNVARRLAIKGSTTLEKLEHSVADILGISEDSELYKVIKRKYPKAEDEVEAY